MDRTDFGQCSMRFKDFHDFLTSPLRVVEHPHRNRWPDRLHGKPGPQRLPTRECQSKSVLIAFSLSRSLCRLASSLKNAGAFFWKLDHNENKMLHFHPRFHRQAKNGNVVAPACRASGHRDHAKAGFFQPVKHGKSFGGKSTLNR